MNRFFLFFFFISLVSVGHAQIERPTTPPPGREGGAPSERREETIEPAPVDLYKIISVDNDTTHVDTSLTIEDWYAYNYLRKDNFGLLPLPNIGQPYNRLTYPLEEISGLMPGFGAGAKQYNFMEVDDVYYYHVPTPFTELYFKTVYEQGQTLDAFFTINTSEYLNFSLAYKGHRSLGRYQHMLTSSGNFRATLSYNSPRGRYHLKTHFVSQDITHEENGGLTPQSLQQYLSENPEFEDRSRLEVRFEDAENRLLGKRFFLEQSYDLYKTADSLPTSTFSVGHRMNISDVEYRYQQARAHPVFGATFEEVDIRDETELEFYNNEGFFQFDSPTLGKLEVKAGWNHYNYGYNTVLDLDTQFIENGYFGDNISAGGSYTKSFGGFVLGADASLNLAGEFEGHNLEGFIFLELFEDVETEISAKLHSGAPAFNLLLYQSDYINYNWQTHFNNQETQSVELDFTSSKWFDLTFSYTEISDYAYFGLNANGEVRPFQYGERVKYLKTHIEKEFRLGRFALDNTLLYQKVLAGEQVLHVPNLVTRHSLYYTDYWFERALFLQTGLTLSYFTDFQMNGYDPILSEFYVQNELEMKGIPSVDFFFNGKVKTARIFFSLENVDDLVSENSSLVAPGYPFRDFGIRFGLVWNFFM